MLVTIGKKPKRSPQPVSATTSAIVRKSIWQRSVKAASKKLIDRLVNEQPLEIRVRGKSVAITMRTPGHDAELAAGFLLSEAMIFQREDVTELAHCARGSAENPENILNVFLAPAVDIDFERLTRHVFASSSCGVCGKASIDSVQQNFPAINPTLRIKQKIIFALPGKLRRAQKVFAQTGALHGAALFDARGKLIVAREDVGRHNAVDKVLGFAFLNQLLPLSSHLLLVSGRTSFEIIQKALSAGIPVVCAVSGPSSLAVEFAMESGQCLIGFLRDGRMNIYSRPELIGE